MLGLAEHRGACGLLGLPLRAQGGELHCCVGFRKVLRSTGGYGLLGMCRGGTSRGEEGEQESGEGRARKGKWAMTRPQNTNDTSVSTGGYGGEQWEPRELDMVRFILIHLHNWPQTQVQGRLKFGSNGEEAQAEAGLLWGQRGVPLQTRLGYVWLWRLGMLCPLEPALSTQDPDPRCQNLAFQVVVIR